MASFSDFRHFFRGAQVHLYLMTAHTENNNTYYYYYYTSYLSYSLLPERKNKNIYLCYLPH